MRRLAWLAVAIFALIGCLTAIPRRHASASLAQTAKLTEIKIDPRKFDELVGQYTFVDSPDLVLSFFREGEKFYLQATDQGRIEIFPASETKFFLKVIDADATFIRDA